MVRAASLPGVPSGTSVVYASADGLSAVVERASVTGLKEDIVLSRSLGDVLRFTWDLELSEGLEARLDADGSIGVYGLSSVLNADIQVADDKSRLLLEKARHTAGKTELRYRIPAPVVRAAGGEARGYFEHSRGRLALVATGLDALTYPVSIDPSVVVTSAADFGAGNFEMNVDLDPTGSVKRAKTQAGTGPWAATTSFAGARAGLTSVAYNGFLYVIGGFDGAANRSDVQVAALNADGSIGAFTATASFATPRDGHTSVAWNGFLYVLGGNAGASYLSDVQVAPINANGTLGAFTATTSFATGRSGHTSVAWNGFLYVICGYNGAYLNDLQVAPLNPNGTVGAFVATTALGQARDRATSVAYNGRLYVLGGSNGARFSDVQVASLNANGTVGPFTATTSFSGARNFHTSVVSNGSLFVMGGFNGGSNLNDVQAAPINADGSVGAFSLKASFAGARRYHASASWKGNVYVLGGVGGAVQADVQFAPVNTTGTLGAFTSTTPLPSARSAHASVAWNGFLYVTGGYNGAVDLADVQVAPLNANGTVGAFVATTSFATPRENHATVAWNGYLYVLGGFAGGYRNDVPMASCGCQSGGAGAASWLAFAVLALAARRRRAR